MSKIETSQAAWDEFERLVAETLEKGQTSDWFARQLRQFVEKHGWAGWWPASDKNEFNRTSSAVFHAVLAVDYMQRRHDQLCAGGFTLWVYRSDGAPTACPREHHLLDGIAVAPDHPFWDIWFPPNTAGCRCRVFGANSEAGIRRVGGDAGKTLPIWWDIAGIAVDTQYVGLARPSLVQIVEDALET